ncbi:trypsin-like peptidase domain-containing protein [Methylobacterium sp. J-067]|uniref:trypsin-like peptidase domain-containing protein n=1 Tax=Methylobacterium sp. J-067 TaxID=2836648 RepID=UPI001FB88586|nr:trypsin-like peptidase domain-containing protein [Methylobacterium sp. J-067]MCJ2026333.1 trypsin-like peptidase domain-containing protein [Methylobacterium sp. J-067]
MTGSMRFVASRTLAGLDPIRIDDRILLEDYERLRRLVLTRCGASVADLFAEPVISRSNGAAPARVDWYTHLDGPIRPLAELDPAVAEPAAQRLRSALATLAPLLRDREAGAFAAACLNLASPLAVLAVGDAPLLVDWGLLPQGLAADDRGRGRHFASTLGAFAPAAMPSPPTSRDDWAAHVEPLPAADPIVSRRLRRAPAWPRRQVVTAPVVATAVAGLLLALSFVPGVLVFPVLPQGVSAEARTLQTAWLDGLRRRRDALVASERFDCPRLRTELPTLVPQSPASVRLPTDPAAPPQARTGLEAPAAQAGPGAQPADGLTDRLERGTVLILAGNATGSGFFVADDLVVTNRHVVEGAPSLLIAGRHAGLVPATLVRVGDEGTLTDFALLRLPSQSGGRALSVAPPGRPLTPVVASGFPGLHLGTDPIFARLREGDAGASRDLVPVLQSGVVNHLQRYEAEAVTLVLHSAEIAPGNSGGPLVDYCGRVVGVNTFGRTDEQMPVTARYALGSDGLLAFLTKAGIAITPDARACDLQASPRVAAAAPAEPAAPTGQAAPRTPARPPAVPPSAR